MFRKLIKYIRGYESAVILGPLLVIVEVLCEIGLPRLMTTIIDDGIRGTGGMRVILQTGGLMLLLALCSMAAGVGSAKFTSRGSQGFGANLRKAMFDHVQEFSFADIDRFSSASLITRLTNDVNNIQRMVNMGLRILVRAPVMLVAALIVCFRLNQRLTLILVCVIPFMALAIGLVMHAARRLFMVFQKKIDALNGDVQEDLVAIRVVKAFVREPYEKQKFAAANDAMRDAALAAGRRVILMNPVMQLSFNFSIVLILWFGGHYVLAGTLSDGELYAFISYIVNVLMSVMMIAFSFLMMTRARASAERINEVLETVPAIRDAEESAAAVLPESLGRVELRDVSFRYTATGSGENVLSHVDMTIEPGQFVAIIGGTGSGKSSLVNLIPRFYDVTDGAVLVDGMDVRDYPLEALRSRIGMVLQNNVLFSGTIRENLLWGKPDATEEEMIRAAKDAQAYDFIMSFPDGFDTYIEQGGVNVSGGQKQRLCIARAMLRAPAILILDDSTSAVDTVTEAAIRRSFHENLKNTTVIIIAQRISSVQSADRIFILDDDRIAGVGTHDELLATNAIYQEIYNSQQEGVIQG